MGNQGRHGSDFRSGGLPGWLHWLLGVAVLLPLLLIVLALEIWALVTAGIVAVGTFLLGSSIVIRLRFGAWRSNGEWPWYVAVLAGALSGVAFGLVLRLWGAESRLSLLHEAIFAAVFWLLLTKVRWPFPGAETPEDLATPNHSGDATSGTPVD